LACNFSALKIDHRRAEHSGSIGIRTALREGETLAYGYAAFDPVSHVAPVDVIKIGRDCTHASQVTWFARRIVTINYLNNGIFRVQAGKRAGVAAFDRALEPSDGDGLGFDSGVEVRLVLGLDLVMLPPLMIGSRYVIIDPDWGADAM
jgi:hypothetical protein